MGYYNRDGDRDGFRGGGFRGRGGRDRRPAEMHDVICDKCKKECQVPFRPTGDKPVLCSDCFRKEGGSRSRDRPSQSGISSEQFNQINEKLDKIINILKDLEIDSDEESETDSKAE